MKIFVFVLYMTLTSFSSFGSSKVLDDLKIERNYFNSIEDEINKIIDNDYTYGAIKIEKYKGTNNSNYKFGSLIAKNIKKDDAPKQLSGFFTFVQIKNPIPEGRRQGRDFINTLGKLIVKSRFPSDEICTFNFLEKTKKSFNKFSGASLVIKCKSSLVFKGEVRKSKATRNIFGNMSEWNVNGYQLDISGRFEGAHLNGPAQLLLVISQDITKGVSNIIPNYLKGFIINKERNISKKINFMEKNQVVEKIIIKEDLKSKQLAQQRSLELKEERARLKTMEIERKRLETKAKQLANENRLAKLNAKKRSEEIAAQEKDKLTKEQMLRKKEEKARKIAQEKIKQLAEERKKAEKFAKQLKLERVILEQKNKERLKKLGEERKRSEKVAQKLRKERKIAEQKTKNLEKSQQTQLASIQLEKRKREELEKKLVVLQKENKKNRGNGNSTFNIKLSPEWIPFQNKMSLQQEQFCQLTNRFFEDIKKASKSGNEIKINIVHKERQENLDGLLPGGKVNNWIFKVIKIDQVEDGSAAVVLSLQCKSFVGSGQIHTRSTWRKKSSKEWRATIPYDDRRFRELAKLDKGQFILGSGIMLEINAFKPGQKETFYASQQIGDHPLAKGLNLEGELFIADLSYIAALN